MMRVLNLKQRLLHITISYIETSMLWKNKLNALKAPNVSPRAGKHDNNYYTWNFSHKTPCIKQTVQLSHTKNKSNFLHYICKENLLHIYHILFGPPVRELGQDPLWYQIRKLNRSHNTQKINKIVLHYTQKINKIVLHSNPNTMVLI